MSTKKFKLTITAEVTVEEIIDTDSGGNGNGGGSPVIANPNTFYGVNTFPWVPVEKIKPFGSARIYCASHWIWQKDGLFIQPMFQAETTVAHGIDDLLISMDTNDVDPLLCIHQTPEWLLGTGNAMGTNSNDLPPTENNTFREVPGSYAKYAQFLWQVAARYGYTKHPESDLDVSSVVRWNGDGPQVPKSGMKLLKYLEPWNECDKWWKVLPGKNTEYFTPEEMAAFMSACYDGHERTIINAGIKNADPTMLVVMPGLTGCDKNYILRMDAWFDKYRKDKDWPCDVFNIHWYNNKGNTAEKYPPTWAETGAINPNDDKALPQFLWVKDFVSNTLDMPLWVTEFGCDSKTPSQMAHPQGEAGQAEHIKACFEFYKLHGVERAFLFTAVDEANSTNGGLWNSCGLLTNEASGFKPKPAFTAMKQVIQKS